MPAVVCSNCSKIVVVNGHTPQSCPECGCTFANAADVTNTHFRPSELAETLIADVSAPLATLGRYEIKSKLGSGGFGVVYRAWDARLNRFVAIKVPGSSKRHSPEAAERFAREGRNAAQLRHPAIVSIYDVEQDGDVVFIVCEFIEGEPLSSVLNQGRLSFRAAASLLAAVAWAVQHAHSKGVVHRDIKPGNIMIDAAGNPRLMDFGLAKREEIDPTVTSDHQVLGTPAYMSPEQAAGNPNRIDRRTDIYSLGAVLYHLLTHKLPFGGAPHAVTRQVQVEAPKRPRTLDKQIPIDLETVCLKAMEKDPAKRYASAGELADDLERWLRGEPIVARHIGRPERAWRWCRRNPAAAGLIASVALLLVVVTIGSGVMAAVQTGARRRIAEALQENRRLLARAYVEKAAQYQDPAGASQGYRPLKSLPWLAAALQFDETDPKRRDAARIRINSELEAAPRVERMWFHKGGLVASGLSPKRDLFFTGSQDGSVQLWRTATSQGPFLSLPHPAPVHVAAISPDETLLATVNPDGIRLWDIATGKLVRGPFSPAPAADKPRGPIRFTEIVFSASGKYLVTADRAVAQIWVVATGKPLGPPMTGPSWVVSSDFLDSERFLLTAHVDGSIRLWDVQWATQKRVLYSAPPSPGRQGIGRIAVAPDGTTVAGTIGADGAALWNAASGEKIGRPLPHEGRTILDLRFSPDGTLLATADTAGTVRAWQVSDGRLLWKRQILSAENIAFEIEGLQFAPNGKALAVTHLRTDVAILDARTGNYVAQPISSASHFAFSGTGWSDAEGSFLSIGQDGVARLWALESHEPAFRLPNHKQLSYVAASADRRAVAVTDSDGVCCVLRTTKGGQFERAGIVSIPNNQQGYDVAALTNDGARLAVSSGRDVSLWDVSSRKQIGADLPHAASVNHLRFAADGRLLVCLSSDGQATVWDVATGRKAYAPIAFAEAGPGANRHGAWDIDVSADGKRFAIAAGTQVTVWDAAAGQRIGPPLLQDGLVQHCRFLPDSRFIVTGSGKGIASVWDISTGRAVASTAKRPMPISCLDAAIDGSMFLTGCCDGTSRLWSTADASPVSPPFEDRAQVLHVLIDPTGRWVATATDLTVQGWDPQLGESLFVRSPGRLESRFSDPGVERQPGSGNIALTFFSADGRSLYALTAGGLFVTIPLDPERRSADEVARDIALRSGLQFDSSGGLKILQPDELAAIWQNRKAAR